MFCTFIVNNKYIYKFCKLAVVH